MKRMIFTLAAAALTMGTVTTPVQAAGTTIVNNCYEDIKSCSDLGYIVLNNCGNNEALEELLKNCDISLKDCGISLEDCDISLEEFLAGICPELPDFSTPITPSPEAPENSTPVTPSPEAPDASTPVVPSPEPSLPEDSEGNEDTENPGDSEGSEDPDESVHPYVLRIVELVNEERAKEGLSPVTLDTNASKAALVRSKEIKKSFSHTRPDGSSFATALKEHGVSYRTAGENIAWGQRSPEEVMEAWMNSAGHRANILNESFTQIGVGYYQENGVNYWTQLFFG